MLDSISVKIYYAGKFISKRILISKFIDYVKELNNDITTYSKHNIYYVNNNCICKPVYDLQIENLDGVIKIKQLQEVKEN